MSSQDPTLPAVSASQRAMVIIALACVLALLYFGREVLVPIILALFLSLLMAPWVRLYRRIGFEVIAKDVPLHGTPKTYTLIHGPFSRVMASLREWDERDHAPSILADTRMPARIDPGDPCMNRTSLGSVLQSQAGAGP